MAKSIPNSSPACRQSANGSQNMANPSTELAEDPSLPQTGESTTQKENKIYVHVLNWTAPLLALPPIATNVAGAHSLPDGGKIEFTQNQDGVILKLAPPRTDEIDRVVVLTLAK